MTLGIIIVITLLILRIASIFIKDSSSPKMLVAKGIVQAIKSQVKLQ